MNYRNLRQPTEEEQSILDQISSEHKISPSFVDRDMSRIDLHNKILDGVWFMGCNLQFARFDLSSLTNARFTNCDVSLSSFKHANLQNSHIEGCNFRKAILDFSDCRDATFRRTTLENARIENANFRNAYLHRVSAAMASFEATDFAKADLTSANFEDAQLIKVNFDEADLNYAIFNGANLTNAQFGCASLEYTRFFGANLSQTSLDPQLHLALRRFLRECPILPSGGRIVYRSGFSRFVGKTEYEPGRTYVAPVFSLDATVECHPGIYAASLPWLIEKYEEETRYVRCYVREGDWVITPKGAIRCKRLRVLSKVTDEELLAALAAS